MTEPKTPLKKRMQVRSALAKRRERLKQDGLCVDCGYNDVAVRERYDLAQRAFVKVKRSLCDECLAARIERNHRSGHAKVAA